MVLYNHTFLTSHERLNENGDDVGDSCSLKGKNRIKILFGNNLFLEFQLLFKIMFPNLPVQ